MSKITPVCWKANYENYKQWSVRWIRAYLHPAHCLLPKGHKGRHKYTPTETIQLMLSSLQAHEKTERTTR